MHLPPSAYVGPCTAMDVVENPTFFHAGQYRLHLTPTMHLLANTPLAGEEFFNLLCTIINNEGINPLQRTKAVLCPLYPHSTTFLQALQALQKFLATEAGAALGKRYLALHN